MPTVGTTGVVALIPVAQPLLALAAEVDPEAVRPGVPAHASLLYPWLPIAEVTPATVDSLRERVAGHGPVEVELRSVVVRSGFVAIPVPGLDGLVAAVRAGWPTLLPYGGRFGEEPGTHVTVAMDGDPAAAERIAAVVKARLPVVQRVGEMHVVGLAETGWQVLAVAPLA